MGAFGEPARSTVFTCCGVRIDALAPEAAVARITAAARQNRTLVLHLCNAYTLSLAQRDRRYRAMLDRADLNLADGVPVTWVGRALGRPAAVTPGPALMQAVFAAGQPEDLRHFLLGSTPEGLLALRAALSAAHPAARVAGSFAPPFTEDVDELVRRSLDGIVQSGANVVWVGLGTPKQDWVAEGLARRLGVVAVPVGAAFDFASRQKPEAPAWLRGTGLEWVFRFGTEPRRLWRRYLLGNPVFLWGALLSIVRERIAVRPR